MIKSADKIWTILCSLTRAAMKLFWKTRLTLISDCGGCPPARYRNMESNRVFEEVNHLLWYSKCTVPIRKSLARSLGWAQVTSQRHGHISTGILIWLPSNTCLGNQPWSGSAPPLTSSEDILQRETRLENTGEIKMLMEGWTLWRQNCVSDPGP